MIRNPADDPYRVEFDPNGDVRFLGSTNLVASSLWAVPTLVLGVPGILLMVIVMAQAGGAFAWLPAIVRFRRPTKWRRLDDAG